MFAGHHTNPQNIHLHTYKMAIMSPSLMVLSQNSTVPAPESTFQTDLGSTVSFLHTNHMRQVTQPSSASVSTCVK